MLFKDDDVLVYTVLGFMHHCSVEASSYYTERKNQRRISHFSLKIRNAVTLLSDTTEESTGICFSNKQNCSEAEFASEWCTAEYQLTCNHVEPSSKAGGCQCIKWDTLSFHQVSACFCNKVSLNFNLLHDTVCRDCSPWQIVPKSA